MSGAQTPATWSRKVALGALGFVVAIAAWQLATWGNDITEVPGPRLTLLGLSELATDGVLWKNIAASVFRVAWGFCLAAGVGIPLGVWMGWNRDVALFFNPTIQMLRPISPIAWIPFAVVIFGGANFMLGGRILFDASDSSAIFLIFLASFFPIVTATTSAVRSIELKYLRSAANFGVTGLGLFRRVILPAALPQILTGLRLALGIAWVVIVAAEMLGVTSGLGFQVNDSRNNLRMDYVSAAMVVIGLVGLALDMAMSNLEASALARRGMSRR
ncbi:MAG: ABC transporter permease [Planctomycetota bacterium]